jgi:LytS/YehU family sensor histidine kinase
VLRRVLSTDRGRDVPLAEEVEFVSRYLEIEQVRFPDRLRATVECDPAVAGAAVPDFILQPLVENAIRHGVAMRSDAGRLIITAHRDGDDLVLAVQDDGHGPRTDERGGVGLANTRERLAMLYGSRGRFELSAVPGGGAIATIRIPYREAADA